MKTPVKCPTSYRRRVVELSAYLILGYCFIILMYYLKYSQSVICLFKNPDYELINRDDEWQYQNTLTGQWYHWSTVYQQGNKDTQWQVKWLNTIPSSSLGVIVYLATTSELGPLKQSLTQLSRLLINNPRPVVIFHEGDFSDNDIQKSLAQTLGPKTPLAFERIQFPDTSNKPETFKHGAPFSYLNMCRFFHAHASSSSSLDSIYILLETRLTFLHSWTHSYSGSIRNHAKTTNSVCFHYG